jgi:hypothetical protein
VRVQDGDDRRAGSHETAHARTVPFEAGPYPGPLFASAVRVEGTQPQIEHHPVGSRGRTAPPEIGGLFLYALTLAGFVYWLLVYGVNV